MKKLILVFSLISANSYAASLKSTADKLAQETNRIGLGLALFGIALAGIYFILGKQDASMKMTQALLGVFVLVLSPAIITFVKGLV